MQDAVPQRDLFGFTGLATVDVDRVTQDCDGKRDQAYVALDGHLPAYPGRDVALLWDEIHGWAAAV
ncbi:DUF6292 family protein, partial [Amycolatopsis sp. NPDC003676]